MTDSSSKNPDGYRLGRSYVAALRYVSLSTAWPIDPDESR